MTILARLAPGTAVLLLAGAAAAAEPTTTTATFSRRAPEGARLAVDTTDPMGDSRFQLITRALASDGRSVLSGQTAWSMEGRFFLSILDGFGVNGALPLGIVDPIIGNPQVFVGNLTVGVSGGATIILGAARDPLLPSPRLTIAGGVDTYLPTAPRSAATAAALLAATHAYDPQLFLPDVLSVRTRAQLGFAYDRLRAHVELAFTPGAVVRGPSQGLLLMSATARTSYAVTEVVEPFLEISATTQLSGGGDVAPPVMLVPGARFHLAEVFSPAIFVAMNFVVPEAVIIGIDLGSAPGNKLDERRRAEAGSPDDFLDF